MFAQQTNREPVKETCVYRGYLVSWRSELLDPPPAEPATRLPLLLCRGTPNTMRAVHSTLSRMFDCMFVALPTSPEDLTWLLPIIISPGGGQDTAKEHEEAILEYTVPGLPRNDCITVRINVNDLIQVWKG